MAVRVKKASKQRAPRVLCHPEWIWHGQAGHFIGTRHCLFHMHTHVAVTEKQSWCISTVGNYFPANAEYPSDVRFGWLFETTVFEYDEIKEKNKSWAELDAQGSNDYDQAVRNHMLMCWAWQVPSDHKELQGMIEQARTEDDALLVLMDRLKETGFLPM